MGTTLTGTTPQDTYDSLIKVTDNGPIGATAKLLTDGLGNDSVLYLGTAGLGIKSTSVLSFNVNDATHSVGYDAVIDGSQLRGQNGVRFSTGSGSGTERLRITSAGNVGIGTSAPNLSGGAAGSTILTVSATSSARNGILELNGTRTTQNDYVAYVRMFNNGAATPVADIAAIRGSSDTTGSLTLSTSNAERLRIDSAGNVGIGTSAPTFTTQIRQTSAGFMLALNRPNTNTEGLLLGMNAVSDGQIATNNSNTLFGTVVSGTFNEAMRVTTAGVLSLTQGQLKFPATQVASADANTLDDYEEGTWTMGVSFDGASAGVTTSINTGTYTKIGRKVTVNGQITLTSKGSSTGNANITGLPFTIANSSGNYSAPSFWFTNITFANQFIAYGIINTTSIDLSEITEAGVVSGITNADFANNSSIIVSFTYFV